MSTMKRYHLDTLLDSMEEDPKGESALSSDLDEALGLLQRWKNRRNHGYAAQLWRDTATFLDKHRVKP